MNANLLREGPILPAVEGPGARSSPVRVVMSPGRLFDLAAEVAGKCGLLSVSPDAIVVEPFSAADQACRTWQKRFTTVNPRRVRTRWTPW